VWNDEVWSGALCQENRCQTLAQSFKYIQAVEELNRVPNVPEDLAIRLINWTLPAPGYPH
ncbi:hypothetical protein NDU88_006362, partial [Pleurodeles waltl]